MFSCHNPATPPLQGLTPTEVVEGYELALKKALELLPGLVCGEVKDLQSEAELKRAIKPSVWSKQYGNEEFITELVVKACSELPAAERGRDRCLV